MGDKPIQPVIQPVTIDIMLNWITDRWFKVEISGWILLCVNKALMRAFWIAQVLFAFLSECYWPSSNLADLWCTKLQFGQFWKKINIYNFYVYHQIIIWLIYENMLNGNLVVHIKIVNIYHFPKLTEWPLGWLHSNANGILGILGAHKCMLPVIWRFNTVFSIDVSVHVVDSGTSCFTIRAPVPEK